MANSISVAVGDSDTIRCLASGAAAPEVAGSLLQPPATRARRATSRGRTRRRFMHPPLGRRMRGLWGSEAQPALPPRTELAATEAGDLARPRRVRAGPHSCGTAPGSHRTSLVPVAPGGGAGQTEYMTDSAHDRWDKTDARHHPGRDAGRVPVPSRDLGLRVYEGRVDDLSPGG